MPVAFVSAASANSTTVAMPTHQAGDMILCGVSGNSSLPTAPAGWAPTQAFANAGSPYTQVLYKVAASGSETTGTFTGANSISIAVYRASSSIYLVEVVPGSPQYGVTIPASNGATGQQSPVTFPDLAPTSPATKSLFVRVLAAVSGSVTSVPTGWVARTGSARVNFCDTDALATSANAHGGNTATTSVGSRFHAHTLALSVADAPSGNFFAFF